MLRTGRSRTEEPTEKQDDMSVTPDDDERKVVRELDADLSDPERWLSLSNDRLCQVIGTAILMYGDLKAEELIPKIERMYPYFVERVPPERRMLLMRNVISRFSSDEKVPDDATRHRVDAILPFMVREPHPHIASAATMEFCVLRGTTDFPWLGVNQAFGMFEHKGQGGVQNPAAILMGLISLGDRRLSPRILSLLTLADVDVAQEVAKLQTQQVLAAVVDLCCDWLEAVQSGPASGDPGGGTFGCVAAAIFRQGARAEETGVAEISMCFPPPTPEDWSVLHQHYTRAEYAKVVGPRLQSLAEREGGPRILPQTMGAWGVECVCQN